MVACGVLIVDDDDFTRMALGAVVTGLGHRVLSQAASVVEAMDAARTIRIDVALMDLDLGEGPTGIDLAHGLRAVQPHLGLLLLSSYLEPRFMGRRSRGLPERAEFLTKQELGNPSLLGDALIRAAAGDARAHQDVNPAALQVPDLTDTQIELMRLVAAGYSNAEIARQLWITEAGVNRAVTRLVKQLDLEVTKDRNPRVLIARAYADIAGRTVARD